MAEVVGLIASVITIGASAAQVSLALFSVVQTLKNAPKQIAEIAEELSSISESLQTLADVIDINRNVCRPAIFKNTHIIISRYKQVDAEIKKLIDTPQKLAGLQWYLNKPKAKGLMKKVEGIKVALILELNIIRLAREEFTRSFSETGASTLAGLPSKPNRFRKVVESAVQANRKVVENAQQDDEDSRAEKLPYANVGLDIWKQDSFDTATWLYHLVFSLDIPYPPETNSQTRRLYQASVTDVSVSSDEEKTLDIPKADTDEKAMIVWNKQTEPSSVVDRLLSSWTTLSPDQITRSAANQDGDEWREGLLRNIEEAKKEDEKTYSDWEQDYLSESSMPTYNSPNTSENHRNRGESSAGPFLSRTGDSPAIRHPRSGRATSSSSTSRKSGEKRRVRFPSHESSDVHSPPRPRYEIRPDHVRHSYRDDDSTSSRINPPLSGWAASTASTPSRGFSNSTGPSSDPYPVRSGYLPSWQDPIYGTQSSTFDPRPPNPFSPAADWANTPSEFSPNHAFVPPQHPQHPQYPRPQSRPAPVPHAQAPSTDDNLPPPRPPEEHPSSTEIAAKEKAIMTAVEDLLERREQNKQLDASEPRFLRLMELFHTQQERELQSERERANTATEAQTKLMQSMHDKDKERLKQLETLVDELRNEEKKLRRLWQVETEERVKEARDTVAKEITALQSAKEEAERQTQQRADTIMATELRKLKRDHKKELDRYEDQLREMQEQQAKREQDAQLPVRRTLIAEGNRSVDVTEYMSDQRNPFHTSSSHLKGLQHGFAQLGIDHKQRQAQHQHPRHSRRDSLHSSTASMQSSRASIGTANTPNPTGFSQQLIVFPAKANRESKEMATLQSSLASLGIDAVFEDPEYEHGSQLIPYNHGDSDDRLVRSTIFWEAPMLTIGSELLLTKRQVGWRPEYVRTSEKGQTHFYGSQPIHAYFFSPDYKPQFSQSTGSSAKESVLIHKSIVHEYALIELGLRHEATDSGNYVLDGRLTYHDIENLVERSFLISENHWRRMYRGLQGHFNKVAYQVPKSAYRFDTRHREANQPSTPYTPSAYSADEDFTNLDDNNYDTEDRESSVTSTATRRRRDDSDHSDWVFTTSRDESSAKSPSVFSASSKSTKNPFRQRMSTPKVDREEFESKPVSANIWDNTVPDSLI